MKIQTWRTEKLEKNYNHEYPVLFRIVPIMFVQVVIGS